MSLSLLSVYDEMLKAASSAQAPEVTEQVKEATAVEQELSTEEQEVLNKYAELAIENLTKEAGEGNFTEEDVIEVASAYITADQALVKEAQEAEQAEAMQKVAEAHELGTIMAEAFLSRISQE